MDKERKPNKQFLSIVLAVMILLSSLPFAGVTAFADTYTSGDYVYYLYEDGTVSISQYNGNETNLTVPSTIDGHTVRGISDRAFANCLSLSTVTIPNGITSIWLEAFYGCTNLKKVTIPNSVIRMGKRVFYNCTALTTVTIPNNLNSINDETFYNCSALTNITIPDSVTSIGIAAFSGCSNLKSITLPNSVTDLKESVFFDCTSLKSIVLSNNIKSIPGSTFTACSALTDITIPDSVTRIGNWAFAWCPSLKSIVIPNSVTKMGENIFWDCSSLKTVTLSNKAEIIGEGTFRYCTSLSSITIPDGVTSINYTAFANCANLESITIPKSVTFIDGAVFVDCDSLKTVYYLGSEAQWEKIEIYDGNEPLENATVFYDYDSKLLPPPTVSSVTATATGIKINWNAMAGAEKYRLLYKTDVSGWKQITDTSSTSYIWTGAKSGTKYTFTVRCVDKDGKKYTSNYDSKGKTITYIAAPKLSSVTNTATGVEISWGKVIGAENYRVFYKTGNGSWTKAGDTTSTSYTWTGAKSGTKYSFTVRCVSSDGKSYTSNYDSAGKSITYIAAPKLSSVSNTDAGVQITWAKSAGAAKYRIFYKTGNGGWTKITDTSATSYTWKGAKSGTKYTFTVRCISSDGKTYTSNFDSTGKSITYVAAPKLSSVSNTATGVKIAWGKVAGAAKYRVFYKTGNSGWKKLTDTTSTSYTWKGAKSGTKYTFTVRCITNDGKSYTSAYDSKGKSITFLSAPKISSLTKNSTGITIKWGKVTGAAKYRVFYKTGNGSWQKLTDTTSTNFTWKGGKKGTKYTFTVRCISKDGKSYTSNFDATGKSITR
ncbi:MAG: leucine-rich repeat protein [Eubacterium sp.]|nr:leucine-rich repeat protein [Eubacterium sp.]